MRSTSVTEKKQFTAAVIDDPLELWSVEYVPPPALPQAPVITGLSDEEDARRHLLYRFGSVLRCPNCETIYEVSSEDKWCDRCGGQHLKNLDAPAIPTKWKDPGA